MILNEFERTTPIFMDVLIAVALPPFSLVIAHLVIQYLFTELANQIVKKIDNINDLSKIIRWLKQSWSIQNVYGFIVPFALIWTVLGLPALSIPIQQFVVMHSRFLRFL